MPGIISTVKTRSGKTNLGELAGTYFVAGITERGVTDALVELRSVADYAEKFGDRVTYGTIFDSLRVFFEEGGSVAKVIRVVGPAATVGTLTLQDSVPADSVTLDAKGAGAWSSAVAVVVAAGTLPNTVKVTITHGEFTEVYDNLATSTAVAQAINTRSNLVTAVDEGGDLPATGTFALSAGTDDRASITTQHYIDALTAYAPKETGPGAVAVPGQLAAAIGNDLMLYARASNKIALLSSAAGADVATAKSDAAGLVGDDASEYGGLFYPWITISVDGALLDVSPEGYVAGVRARAIAQEGPWRAPAGEIARSSSIVAPAVTIGQDDGDDLDSSNVNAIRTIYGSPRLYGWRSLSADTENYSLLTSADVINYVLSRCDRVLEEFVFENVDGKGQLFSNVYSAVVGELQPISDAGGLFPRYVDGEQEDPGYSVTADETVNTPQTLALNQLRVDVGLRVSPSAAQILFNLTKVSVTAAL